jgi:hypothetical protein
MINAPVLVLTAAGMSVIAKGGIDGGKTKTATGAPVGPTQTLQFWTAIVGASAGIMVIDRFNSNLASGLAALWIVGGIIANGPVISKWLTGLSTGLKQ